MSLSATLWTALSGLSTAQRGLGVTAHNVANANTEGYTRKVAAQEAVIVGERGAGTRALDPQRVVDEFLDGELREQRSRLGRSDALLRYHGRVQESLFGAPGDGDRGVANRISRLATAAEALANAPEKTALRLGFVGAAQDLVRQIADDAGRVQALRGDADREIGQAVDAINADARALHQLNLEIARSRSPTELLDRRDDILNGLAEKLPVSVLRHDDGAISVYTRGGQALLEQEPSRLGYRPAARVGTETVFNPIRVYSVGEIDPRSGEPFAGAAGMTFVTGGVRAKLTPELVADTKPDATQAIVSPLDEGRLQGLLDARDRALPELADQLGELAGVVRFALNAAHNDAVPFPPPGSLVGNRTDLAAWNGNTNGGVAYLAVIDRATGSTVRTVAIDATAASPAALAAQIDAGLAGFGTAGLGADGALAISLNDPAGQGLAWDEGDSSIPVEDAAGHVRDYGLGHYLGLNDLIVSTGPDITDLAVRPDILADGTKLSAVAVTVDLGPPPAALAGGAGDNRPAKALAAAMQRGVDTVARGQLAARRATAGEYATDLVALSAVQSEQARNAEAADRAVVDDLAFRQGSVSGVNMDEELSKLVLYQQAYSVSARIVSIANELFDDLLGMAR